MLTIIKQLLDKQTVQIFRTQLEAASWEDGRATAGTLAIQVKNNRQLPRDSETAINLGTQILALLRKNSLFVSAALPHRIHPPKFNRYAGGEHYGQHVDAAIMALPKSRELMRSDLSATIFLCEPGEYDGGELVMHGHFGAQRIKLDAGDMVLYPSSSLHEVTPVTRGERICSFFWIQSMVADDEQRRMLFELDQSIQTLTRAKLPEQKAALLQLTGVYHNLLRHLAKV